MHKPFCKGCRQRRNPKRCKRVSRKFQESPWNGFAERAVSLSINARKRIGELNNCSACASLFGRASVGYSDTGW